MPLYEYECTACKKHTEKIQKFSDAEITVCPLCGGKLKRVITAPAIAFKGGGWYADGYGNAKPASSSGEGSLGGESKDGAGGKADSTARTASPATEGKPSSGGESTPTPAVAPPSAAPAVASSDKK